MLQEMAGLGFGHVELSHGIRISLVPGILQALDEGTVRVSSMHNFCPLPAGVTHAAPNLFEPSSREPREHAQWNRHTKRSIDFAAQVGSPVLPITTSPACCGNSSSTFAAVSVSSCLRPSTKSIAVAGMPIRSQYVGRSASHSFQGSNCAR